MPINNADLIYRRPALLSDATPAQNGGRMLSSAIVSGVKNNVFPDTRSSERNAGSDVWRKLFVHVASAGNEPLLDTLACVSEASPGDDFTLLYEGTATDTQDQVSGRPYGLGLVADAAAAGAVELAVQLEGGAAAAALEPIQAGDVLRLSPMSNPVDLEVAAVVASSGLLTIQLAAPLANAVLAGTVAASVLQVGTLQASVTAPAITSAAGTLAGISARNRGGVAQAWGLTFTSATDFRLDGDTLGGAVATGTTLADFSPANSGTGSPYFVIPAGAWGGAWVAGDTVAFETTPAAAGLWLRRITPAGATRTDNNAIRLLVVGESE